MTVSVIVVTLNRPECVRQCLMRLGAQQPPADQIIVVDASSDQRTRVLVAEFAGVLYLHNPSGYGHMTESRNIGLMHATGEIIAFLDDDSYAHDGWLANLASSYADPSVGAVGGRALNGVAGEEQADAGEIGRLRPDGLLTGNFAVDPGRTIEVDHLIGCNMSFRRDVLAALGGLRPDYPGTEVREESDLCIRVRRLGYRILFNPTACVDHIGAPQAVGRRFDARYAFYAAQNHCILLIRNYGLLSGITIRYLGWITRTTVAEFAHRLGSAIARLAITAIGTALGIFKGAALRLRHRGDPVRRQDGGRAITQALGIATADRTTPAATSAPSSPKGGVHRGEAAA